MDLKEHDKKGNLNVEISAMIIRKAKTKSAMIGIDLKEFVEKVLDEHTTDVKINGDKNGK